MNKPIITQPYYEKTPYPYLGSEALLAFNLLEISIFIYDLETLRVCWANIKARTALNLSHAEEMQLTEPASIAISADADEIVRYRTLLGQGESVDGALALLGSMHGAITLPCRMRGASLSGHDKVALAQVIEPAAGRITGISEALAHDLRTPLSLIDSSAQILDRKSENIPPEQIREKAQRIRRSVERLSRMIDDAYDHNLFIPPPQQLFPLNLPDLVRDIGRSFQDDRSQPKVEINSPANVVVNGDRELLERLFTNLINNSIKFSTENPFISINIFTSEKEAFVDIRDKGIGIPKEERKIIFLNYARGANSDGIPGTGLGLSIARRIVELHCGSIAIVDSDAPGTTVRIAFPLLKSLDEQAQAGTDPAS